MNTNIQANKRTRTKLLLDSHFNKVLDEHKSLLIDIERKKKKRNKEILFI